MNIFFSKVLSLLLTAALTAMSLSGCSGESTAVPGNSKIEYSGEVKIILSDNEITADGETVGSDSSDAVFISNDVIYYEDKDVYESGNPYGEGSNADKHTAEEAAATTVVNITKAGYYRISGKMSQGQIRIDLGEDAAEDENAVVTLVLDNADINCDVAPAVVFMNVYECDNNWSTETATSAVDTSNAGANVIIADYSTNNIEGAYVAKIYKDKEGEKKLWKQDGAFYSYMSMNVDGEVAGTGILNIKADNEGLDSELHLTINGGNINIFSDNDGINTNEDGVSVTTINGGNVHIIAGLGAEGDGIDSNGWLVINGGVVISSANPAADAGLDSDMGSYVNGGTVVALGSTMDWAESDSEQITMNLQFDQQKESDSAIIVTKEDGTVVFAYDPSEDEVVGSNIRRFRGAILSCPEFTLNDSYNVYIGGTVNGNETAGVYDISTVKDFSGAVQQAYTGSDIMMRPGGMGGFEGFGGGKGPGGNSNPGNMGEMPEFGNGEKPEGFENFNPEGNFNFDGNFNPDGNFGGNSTFPEGGQFNPGQMRPDSWNMPNFANGEMPESFENFGGFDGNFQFDEDGNPIGFGGEGQFDFNNGENVADSKPAQTSFYMQDKVNNFSGVADYNI